MCRKSCAVRRCGSRGGERPSPLILSQQGGGAGGSLSRVVPVRVGAAPTTPGRIGTARGCGSGQRDGKVYERNQCLTPLNGPPARIWWIWAGRGAHLLPAGGGELLGRHVFTGREATVKACGVAVAMLQGHSWAPTPSNGSGVNVGTIPPVPFPGSSRLPGGKAHRRPMPVGWGGGPVVVRGRESRPHGEGVQCVRGAAASSGGRR